MCQCHTPKSLLAKTSSMGDQTTTPPPPLLRTAAMGVNASVPGLLPRRSTIQMEKPNPRLTGGRATFHRSRWILRMLLTTIQIPRRKLPKLRGQKPCTHFVPFAYSPTSRVPHPLLRRMHRTHLEVKWRGLMASNGV